MLVKSAVILIASIGLIACYPKGVTPAPETCVDPGPQNKIPYQVRLEIYEDSLGQEHLLVLEPQQCGNNTKAKGCIEVPEDKWAEITFKLLNGRPQNCQGAGLKPWRLEGVQMSMKAKDTTGTVTDAVKCDFGTDDDGHVLNPVVAGPNMKIRDWNLEEYDVFYTVTAVSCTNPNERITTDPWIENKG